MTNPRAGESGLVDELFDSRELPQNVGYEPESGSRRPPPLPQSRRPSGFVNASGRDASQPGELLAGKYMIERAALRSGNALVFQVRHADLGQRFLLKCLTPEASADPENVSLFLKGARLALPLSSEHSARTVDAGRLNSGAPYIVTEALVGCDLREALRVRGVLSPIEAVDFVLQACEAVAEAHVVGLVHKHLNLSNLFATRRAAGQPLIKVLDFGVAEAFSPDPLRVDAVSPFTSMNSIGLAPALEAIQCFSPEQIRGVSEVDGRTDIWALGAILHELICGAPVYRAPSAPGLLAMIVADPPQPVTSLVAGVSAGLEAVILRCLEKERSARFPSVADFAVALKDFASPEAQASINGITRTLSGSRMTSVSSALVHVGPAVLPPAPPPATVAAAQAPARSSLIALGVLILLGQIGGTAAAVWGATRSQPAQALVIQQPAPPQEVAPSSAFDERRVAANESNAPAPAAVQVQPPLRRDVHALSATEPRAGGTSGAARADGPSVAENPPASVLPERSPTKVLPAPAPRKVKAASAATRSSDVQERQVVVADGKDLFDSVR